MITFSPVRGRLYWKCKLRSAEMTFAERLRAARGNAGYTGKEFAANLGIKYETYIGYENKGREPKYETLIKIAAALHASIDELLGYPFEEDNANLADGLRRVFRILDSPERHFAGQKLNERDIEELDSWLKALWLRVKDMAYR